jgi:hypothetical protein
MSLEPHLRLHFDLGDATRGDRRLDEPDGKLPNLERPDRRPVPRATSAAVVRLVVVTPVFAALRPVATLALVVLSVPALVMRGSMGWRRGVVLRTLLMLSDLGELTAEAVKHGMHLVGRNHRVGRWGVRAGLWMGKGMRSVRERRRVLRVKECIVIRVMTLGHGTVHS